MLLLSNLLIFDGTVSDPVHGSILLDDDRIAAIGAIPEVAAEVIDFDNHLAVCPGFIDLHSHSDLQVLDGRTEKLLQGVTLEVVGNCGFSPFPYGHHLHDLQEFGSGILGKPDQWGWPNAASYLKALADSGSADSARALLGHGSLRIAVCGPGQAKPTSKQLDEMAGILEDSLDAGCAGFSSGLMYAPGSSAEADEFHYFCAIVARRGKLYATHMRSYSATLVEAVREQISIAEHTGCRLQISHLQAAGRDYWHLQQPALDEIEAARLGGIDIEFDIYPYQCGSTVLTQLLPQWTLDGGNTALIRRLRDGATRKSILEELESGPAKHWGDVTISSVNSADNQWLIGRTLVEIAELRSLRPAECALDLLLEEHAAVNIVSFNQSEQNLRQLITHPLCSVITDGFYVKGKPHPRLHGTYPELLGRLSRELGWLSLAEAIHKSTAKPAARLNLSDRGLLRPGFLADLLVFDPSTIGSNATYEDPARAPCGIIQVFKNGKPVELGTRPA